MTQGGGDKKIDLKKIRNAAEYTQEYVAACAKIERASYGNIETGERRPSVEVAKRIAAVLGFDWTQFFEDETEEVTGIDVDET